MLVSPWGNKKPEYQHFVHLLLKRNKQCFSIYRPSFSFKVTGPKLHATFARSETTKAAYLADVEGLSTRASVEQRIRQLIVRFANTCYQSGLPIMVHQLP